MPVLQSFFACRMHTKLRGSSLFTLRCRTVGALSGGGLKAGRSARGGTATAAGNTGSTNDTPHVEDGGEDEGDRESVDTDVLLGRPAILDPDAHYKQYKIKQVQDARLRLSAASQQRSQQMLSPSVRMAASRPITSSGAAVGGSVARPGSQGRVVYQNFPAAREEHMSMLLKLQHEFRATSVPLVFVDQPAEVTPQETNAGSSSMDGSGASPRAGAGALPRALSPSGQTGYPPPPRAALAPLGSRSESTGRGSSPQGQRGSAGGVEPWRPASMHLNA